MLKGRKLDYAVMQVCHSQNDENKEALVGSQGKLIASKGLWHAVLGIDLGDWFPYGKKMLKRRLR